MPKKPGGWRERFDRAVKQLEQQQYDQAREAIGSDDPHAIAAYMASEAERKRKEREAFAASKPYGEGTTRREIAASARRMRGDAPAPARQRPEPEVPDGGRRYSADESFAAAGGWGLATLELARHLSACAFSREAVYVACLSQADCNTGRVRMTSQEISDAIGIPLRTVQGHLTTLWSRGALDRAQRRGESGYVYWISTGETP